MHYKGSIIDFPKRIVLNNLEGLPEIIDIAILGGLDSATVRILNFSIECDFSANLSMIFDFETYKFETLDFYFEGIQFLALEQSNELYYQKLREEFSIVYQANKILMEHKELSKYQEALKSHLKCTIDPDINHSL